jgi:hypothetical protein
VTRVNSGIKWEYTVRDYFKAHGYEVMRAAGSKGAMDLLVWKKHIVVAIQCKKETQKHSYTKDWERLLSVTMPEGWSRQLWIKRGKLVTIKTLNGEDMELSITDINRDIKAK